MGKDFFHQPLVWTNVLSRANTEPQRGSISMRSSVYSLAVQADGTIVVAGMRV
jgi:hypothetical protein